MPLDNIRRARSAEFVPAWREDNVRRAQVTVADGALVMVLLEQQLFVLLLV